jgi:tetratricopeptide (TPR) repeat protein
MRKYGKDNVASKIVWILNEAVDDAAKSKDEIYFKYIVERLKKYDVGKKYELKNEFGSVNGWLTYTDLVSWNTLEFYSRFGDEQKYQSSFSKYIQDIWNKHDLLNNLAWSYYETMDDTTRLNNAVKCIKRAIELKNDPNFVDTYASLLYKLKKYPEAMHQAKLALQIAIERKIDTKPFLNTIDMVKNKINNTE